MGPERPAREERRVVRDRSFRPWAARGEVVSAVVTVLDARGHVVRTVRESGAPFTVSLRPGERAVIAAGGLRDAFGETNGVPIRVG